MTSPTLSPVTTPGSNPTYAPFGTPSFSPVASIVSPTYSPVSVSTPTTAPAGSSTPATAYVTFFDASTTIAGYYSSDTCAYNTQAPVISTSFTIGACQAVTYEGYTLYGKISSSSCSAANGAWSFTVYSDSSCTQYITSATGSDSCSCGDLYYSDLSAGVRVACQQTKNTCVVYAGSTSCSDTENGVIGTAVSGACTYDADVGASAIISCNGGTAASSWSASFYSGSGCSGNPITTVSGSYDCSCQTYSTYAFLANCGGWADESCVQGSTTSTTSTTGSSSLSPGAMAGLAVGVIVGVAVLGVLAWLVYAWKIREATSEMTSKKGEDEENSAGEVNMTTNPAHNSK